MVTAVCSRIMWEVIGESNELRPTESFNNLTGFISSFALGAQLPHCPGSRSLVSVTDVPLCPHSQALGAMNLWLLLGLWSSLVRRLINKCVFPFDCGSLRLCLLHAPVPSVSLCWSETRLCSTWGVGACVSSEDPFRLVQNLTCSAGEDGPQKFVDCECSHFLVQFPFSGWQWWWLLLYFLLLWWVLSSFAPPSLTGSHFFITWCYCCWGENYGQVDVCSVVSN